MLTEKRPVQWLQSAPDKPNLADELTDSELSYLGQEVVRMYNLDRQNRKEWDDLSKSALKLAKQIKEPKTTPWQNCANIKHPLITSATIQFAARAYPEICKGARVVKCQITGDDPPPQPVPQPQPGMPGMPGPSGMAGPEGANIPPELLQALQSMGAGGPGGGGNGGIAGPNMSPEGQMAIAQGGQMMQVGVLDKSPKRQRADRIETHLNWQLTQQMEDWESDMDTLLHVLPVVGQCYKKTYYNPEEDKNISELVLPDDCVVSKSKTRNIKKARRITHRLWIYDNDAEERMRSGVWREVKLGRPPDAGLDTDAPHKFLEQHCYADLDGDGYKEPYIITVHKVSMQVVRVMARWQVDGLVPTVTGRQRIAKIKPDHYFTHFGFIPNPDGSLNYLGFGQLLEPINSSVNTILNQLIDSGTLYNVGGGFIGRGVRMRGGEYKIKPGQWIPVDTAGSSLKENIVPLPTREPSTVLFQLLGFLVQAGKEISSVQDILTGGAQLAATMPVGTMMALVEQGLKVFTAIYKRIYRSLGEEFKKHYNLNSLYLDPTFTYYISGQEHQIGQADYLAGDTLVVPVADPDLSSDMQRLLKAQALKDLTGRPGLNEVEITRQLVRAIRPENMNDVLLSDDQMSGKAPVPWAPPPNPQVILAQAKAAHLNSRAQQAAIQMQMDLQKFVFEMEGLIADIAKTKADTVLSLARAEAADAGPQLQAYQSEMQMINQQVKAETDLIKERIKQFGQQQKQLTGPEGQETPEMKELAELDQMGGEGGEGGFKGMIEGRAAGGPVNPNQPYLVGEDGPEIMVPGQGGYVIPDVKTWKPTTMPPEQEAKFREDIKATPWYKEFVEKYKEEPNLDDLNYDYRGAWRAGMLPTERNPVDNMYHWSDRTEEGQWLKSPHHPTAWANPFIETFGVNPDDLPPDDPRIVEFSKAWHEKYPPKYNNDQSDLQKLNKAGDLLNSEARGYAKTIDDATGNRLSSFLDKTGEVAGKVAEVPGADFMVTPMFGLPWKETLPKLMAAVRAFRKSPTAGRFANPSNLAELDRILLPGSKSYNALERITDIPSTKRLPLVVSDDPLVGSHRPAGYYKKDSFLQGKDPDFWGSTNKIAISGQARDMDPVSVYAHEASHGFLGPLIWDPFNPGTEVYKKIHAVGAGKSLYSAAHEGFVDGMSNAILGRYGKNAHLTYWEAGQLRNEPLYTEAGELGVKVGKMLRNEKDLDVVALQSETIDRVMDMLKKRAVELGMY